MALSPHSTRLALPHPFSTAPFSPDESVIPHSSLTIEVRSFRPIEHDEVTVNVLVQLAKLLLEVQAARLVFVFPLEVFVASHFAVVAAVEFKHVAQGLLAFYIELVKFLNERQCRLEVSLKRQ